MPRTNEEQTLSKTASRENLILSVVNYLLGKRNITKDTFPNTKGASTSASLGAGVKDSDSQQPNQ